MPSKYALVSAIAAHIGPWIRHNGDEESFDVRGTEVVLELDSEQPSAHPLPIGLTPVPKGSYSRFRICKTINDSIPTTVRVVLT